MAHSLSIESPPTQLTTWVGRFTAHLSAERGLSHNTVQAYRRDLTRYAGFLTSKGVSTPDAVTTGHIEMFVQHISSPTDGHQPLAPASVSRMVAAVRGFHSFLVREGAAENDPAAAVAPPAQIRRLPKALPIATVERILLSAAADDSALGLRDLALLELLYATGARVSELLALDVDDAQDLLAEAVDDDTPMIRLRGKGDKQRVVPVGRQAREALAAYLVRGRPAMSACGRGPALFLSTRGSRLSRQAAHTVVAQRAASAGVPGDISPHAFRHSFATHLISAGADVRAVQELLGHASVTTTQVYTLVTIDTLREVYATCHPRALFDPSTAAVDHGTQADNLGGSPA